MKGFVATYVLAALACAVFGQMEEQLYNSGQQDPIHTSQLKPICTQNGICGDYVKERRCKRNCLKRAARQDDLGPFWANRGKKDPSYGDDKLYVDEPHWLIFRRDEGSYDPFFITRGKKEEQISTMNNIGYKDRRANRDYKKMIMLDESPFMAARGKKSEEKFI